MKKTTTVCSSIFVSPLSSFLLSVPVGRFVFHHRTSVSLFVSVSICLSSLIFSYLCSVSVFLSPPVTS
jgi:hypothetical protein